MRLDLLRIAVSKMRRKKSSSVAKPRGPGIERAALLDINGQIFVEQGKALNVVAPRNIKVMVVRNPCNTNALICMKNAPDISAKNFYSLTRLDENRAKCQVGSVTAICVTCFLIRCFVVVLSAFDANTSLDILDHPILNMIYSVFL